VTAPVLKLVELRDLPAAIYRVSAIVRGKKPVSTGVVGHFVVNKSKLCNKYGY
jgi:hypothetical protein